MNAFDSLGKILIFIGLVLVVVGLVVLLLPKVPFLGKFPGDLFFKGDKFSIYFPITTSIIISIILTLLFSLFRR
ncbi:MAG: DUF2905 family protein [Deltaproteobacteria bacterium]|nr:DUF2905 family protein [Deltaproteobacteria bacterium]